MKRTRKQNGFTLVELMIVIVIIGILAGVVLMNVGPQTDKARRARAVADIKEMDSALEIYHADSGVYPSTQQGLQALVTQPTNPPVPRNWQGPYLKNRSKPPLDPWGTDYRYLYPGQHNPNGFDLFSYGKDMKPGGQDNDADVVPWDQ